MAVSAVHGQAAAMARPPVYGTRPEDAADGGQNAFHADTFHLVGEWTQ
jgi:hypothetical protein